MPTPNKGESRDDFVKRCIPIVMKDGTAKDNKQAVAVCYSMYDQKKSVDGVVKMMGMMDDMSGEQYAQQECWDIQQAAQALSFIGSMCMNECDEPDDIQSLANIMRSLMEFIGGEIQEMVLASKQGENYEKSIKSMSSCTAACRECISECKSMMEMQDNSAFKKCITACRSCLDALEKNDTSKCASCASACRACADVCGDDKSMADCKSACIDCARECEAMSKKSYIKISRREDVNPKEGKEKYGDVTFADEKNKKYPIDTEEHIRAAWNYISKQGNADKYSSDEVAQIKRKIVAAWKEKIDKEGPPSAEKSLNLSYIKSLGIVIPENELAVKYVSRDTIRHPVFIWGDKDHTDLEGEFFTRDTDFWDKAQGKTRPLTWDHAQDPDFDADPLIGQTLEWDDDDIARWAISKLDTSHKYRKAIDALIEKKSLGSAAIAFPVIGASSDSAPQYVHRVKVGKSTWLARWPWFATALTPAPCEPRMVEVGKGVEFMKSLGIALPDNHEDWESEMAILDYFKVKFQLGE